MGGCGWPKSLWLSQLAPGKREEALDGQRVFGYPNWLLGKEKRLWMAKESWAIPIGFWEERRGCGWPKSLWLSQLASGKREETLDGQRVFGYPNWLLGKEKRLWMAKESLAIQVAS